MSTEAPRKILIVEDDKIIAFDLKLSLESLGYEVCGPAGSYENAIRIAIQQEPALAVVDIHIKGIKTGIDTARTLKENLDIPVIFLTSSREDKTMASAIEIEPFAYLQKPVDKENLHTNIAIAFINDRNAKRLRNDVQRFSHAMQTFEDAIFLTDTEGSINFLNAKAEQLSGWLVPEKIHHSIDEIVESNKASALSLIKGKSDQDALTASPFTFPEETLIRHKTGSKIPAYGTISPFFDADGRVEGYLLTLEKKDTESQNGPKAKTELENTERGNTWMMDGYFFIRDRNQLFRVNVNDINWVEALGDYVSVVTDEKKFTTLITMKKLELMLPAGKFIRVHRSYIVAAEKITAINSNDFDLYLNEKRIPIGETYRTELLKKIKII